MKSLTVINVVLCICLKLLHETESQQHTCQAGEYWDGDQASCEQCDIGSYQDEVGQADCEPCASPKVTQNEGATSVDQCILSCSAGNYYNAATDACTACPKGYFNPDPDQIECQSCPFLTSSPGTGSTLETQCTEEVRGCSVFSDCVTFSPSIQLDSNESCFCNYNCLEFNDCCDDFLDKCANCDLGYEFNTNINNCTECPLNEYKDNTSRDCQPCPSGYRTENTGTTSQSECKAWCSAGQHLTFQADNSTVCNLCPLDTYKVESDYYAESCTPCPTPTPRNYATGATSSDSCVYAACTSGQQFNPANPSSCQSCPSGTYQDSEYPRFNTDVCQNCPDGTGTREEGSTSDQCIPRCDDGLEHIKSSNSCEACGLGMYKDNTVSSTTQFDNCTQCPEGFTTSITGATKETDCSVELASCPAGQEYEPVSEECKPCDKGQYKDTIGTDSCEPCVEGYTTEGNGTDSSGGCSVEICYMGEYRNQVNGSCEVCLVDTYQNLENQHSCEDCPQGQGTNVTGATEVTQCKDFCPSGQELDDSSCSECSKGYYKDNSESVNSRFEPCQPCPSASLTTESTGAVGVDQCTVVICEPGSFSNPNSECELCPYATYQSNPGQGQCVSCDDDKGTNEKGADSVNQCEELTTHRFIVDVATGIDCTSFSVTDSSDPEFQRYRTLAVQGAIDEVLANIDEDLKQQHIVNFVGFRCFSPLNVVLELMLSNLQTTATTVSGVQTALDTALSDNMLGVSLPVRTQSGDLVALNTDLECTAGYFTDLQINDCLPCPNNTYQPTDVRELCWPCPVGTYTVSTGSVGECLDPASQTSTSQVTVIKNVSFLAIGLSAGFSGLFLLALLISLAVVCFKREQMWSKVGTSYTSRSTVRTIPHVSRSSQYRGTAYNPYTF